EPARLDRDDTPEVNAVTRPEFRKADQHAEDGARSADDRRIRLEEHRRERRNDGAREIKPEETAAAEHALEPRPEEEEPDHVEQEVQDVGGQERVRNDSPRPFEDEGWLENVQIHDMGDRRLLFPYETHADR